MLAPGPTDYPDHQVTTEPVAERVEVFLDGEKVAETKKAIKLMETGHHPVYYIPREDITGLHLTKFGDYECPFKGKAEIYSIKHGSHHFENAAWSYLETYDDMEEIKGKLAFYPGKIQLIRVTG